jgi:hypothetical protein
MDDHAHYPMPVHRIESDLYLVADVQDVVEGLRGVSVPDIRPPH